MPTQVEIRYPAIIVGEIGELQMISGWYERQRDGRNGIPYRASNEDGRLILRRSPLAKTLSVLLSGPIGLRGGPMEGRIVINHRKYALPLGVDAWVIRSFPIESRQDTLEVSIRIADPVVPDHVIANGDPRPLGWYVSAVWQE